MNRLPYPTVLFGSVLAAWLALRAGAAPEAIAGTTLVCAGLVIAVLEVVLPHAEAWRPRLRTVGLDLVHALVTGVAVAPAAKAVLLVTLASAMQGLHGLWPAELPLALQVVLAVLLADLGAYAGHRFMHATDLGWRMHAVHHTPQALNLLASARTHPLNAVLTFSLENLPLLLLGAPPETILLWTVVKGTNGLLQHSNVSFASDGVWSTVLATPEVHRWHHSAVLEESCTNFGNTTVIWDRVFGTLHLPTDRQPSTDVGIAGTMIPENYWSHLVAPFVLRQYETD